MMVPRKAGLGDGLMAIKATSRRSDHVFAAEGNREGLPRHEGNREGLLRATAKDCPDMRATARDC
ncbi:MAG: hypothetical protein ACPGWR_18975 [Ardenticatenaceae bacterium]